MNAPLMRNYGYRLDVKDVRKMMSDIELLMVGCRAVHEKMIGSIFAEKGIQKSKFYNFFNISVVQKGCLNLLGPNLS